MEKKEDAEIDVEDIGTILKSSRLKSKKSLEEISDELCIRKIYLTALEEGDYETLEPVPYGIGYMRTYARYLGLNPERAVKLYKAAAIEETTENEEEIISEPEANKSNKRHIILGILALAITYVILNLCASDSKNNNQIEEEKIVEESIPEATQEENIVSEENKEVDTESEVTEEEKKIDTKEPEQEKTATESLAPKANKILMSFSGETWLELKDKNKIYIQGVFHKGDKREIEYKKNMFLSVGRPQNLTIYVNGKKKDVISKRRKSNIPVDSLK